MKKIGIVMLASLLVLVGCGGQVKFNNGKDSKESISAKQYKFNSVKIVYSTVAKEKLIKYKGFKPQKLHATVTDYFTKQGLIDASASHVLEIRVKDLFLRSTIKALLIPISDPDKMNAVVSVKTGSGEQVLSFKVDASYSLGGTTSALAAVRTRLVFKQLSQLVSDVFTGKKRESDF